VAVAAGRLTLVNAKLHATIQDMTPKEADVIKSNTSLPLDTGNFNEAQKKAHASLAKTPRSEGK
jgi:hypothetical protein